MRNLSMDEFDFVEGGSISFKWAVRLGEIISNGISLYEAGSKIEFDPSSYGSVDAGGYNPMGDYTSGICAR